MNLIDLVGRPVPEVHDAKDVILSALISGEVRPVNAEEERLLRALPELISSGLILIRDAGYVLAPGAKDAAYLAKKRLDAARDARAAWGRELHAVLKARRSRL